MLSKYQQFKSWWYWNMPDKEDIIFFGGITIALSFGIWAAVESYNDRTAYVAECKEKGGITVRGANHIYYCIDKEAIK